MTIMPWTYLQSAVLTASLSPGWVFQGADTAAMYATTLRLAQVLNCTQPPTPAEACGQCQPCRWIGDNAHPAMMTLSRQTYWVSEDSRELSLLPPEHVDKLMRQGKTQKNINARQVAHLILSLSHSTDAFRVVVFTDAKEFPATAETPPPVMAPFEWRSLGVNADRVWVPRPLHHGMFADVAVNRFLKTLEEPPPRTVVIFLTSNVRDLLETIVSRCQVLSFPTPTDRPDPLLATLAEPLTRFWAEVMNSHHDRYALQDWAKATFYEEAGLTPPQWLELLQADWRHRQREMAVTAPARFRGYEAVLRQLETTRQALESKANPDHTVNQLLFALPKVTRSERGEKAN